MHFYPADESAQSMMLYRATVHIPTIGGGLLLSAKSPPAPPQRAGFLAEATGRT